MRLFLSNARFIPKRPGGEKKEGGGGRGANKVGWLRVNREGRSERQGVLNRVRHRKRERESSEKAAASLLVLHVHARTSYLLDLFITALAAAAVAWRRRRGGKWWQQQQQWVGSGAAIDFNGGGEEGGAAGAGTRRLGGGKGDDEEEEEEEEGGETKIHKGFGVPNRSKYDQRENDKKTSGVGSRVYGTAISE